MNLYNIMLNERNQTLKATYCMVLLYLHEMSKICKYTEREQVDGCGEMRAGKRNCLLSKGLYFDFFSAVKHATWFADLSFPTKD